MADFFLLQGWPHLPPSLPGFIGLDGHGSCTSCKVKSPFRPVLSLNYALLFIFFIQAFHFVYFFDVSFHYFSSL
jgi:hypothetical protein